MKRKTVAKRKRALIKPDRYDSTLAQALCDEIEVSQIGLRRLCEKLGMPTIGQVKRWLRESEEFRALYARAKQEQAEMMAEDILDIADDGRNDTFLTAEGKEVVDNDVIQRSKLRVDARKWLASKLLPKKYGDTDRTTVNVGVAVNNITVSETERAELMARKRAAAERAKLVEG